MTTLHWDTSFTKPVTSLIHQAEDLLCPAPHGPAAPITGPGLAEAFSQHCTLFHYQPGSAQAVLRQFRDLSTWISTTLSRHIDALTTHDTMAANLIAAIDRAASAVETRRDILVDAHEPLAIPPFTYLPPPPVLAPVAAPGTLQALAATYSGTDAPIANLTHCWTDAATAFRASAEHLHDARRTLDAAGSGEVFDAASQRLDITAQQLLTAADAATAMAGSVEAFFTAKAACATFLSEAALASSLIAEPAERIAMETAEQAYFASVVLPSAMATVVPPVPGLHAVPTPGAGGAALRAGGASQGSAALGQAAEVAAHTVGASVAPSSVTTSAVGPVSTAAAPGPGGAGPVATAPAAGGPGAGLVPGGASAAPLRVLPAGVGQGALAQGGLGHGGLRGGAGTIAHPTQTSAGAVGMRAAGGPVAVADAARSGLGQGTRGVGTGTTGGGATPGQARGGGMPGTSRAAMGMLAPGTPTGAPMPQAGSAMAASASHGPGMMGAGPLRPGGAGAGSGAQAGAGKGRVSAGRAPAWLTSYYRSLYLGEKPRTVNPVIRPARAGEGASAASAQTGGRGRGGGRLGVRARVER